MRFFKAVGYVLASPVLIVAGLYGLAKTRTVR